jgi:uncharacterized protein
VRREFFLKKIEANFRVHPICALLGPRQVGKTTLARMYTEQFLPQDTQLFDLENPLDLAQFDNPMLTLSTSKKSFIVIDEVQRKPELFPILRVLVDSPESQKRFLILGSASRELIHQSSETLAGRLGYIELPPFSFFETKKESKLLWLRGGFPRSYLAENSSDSNLWRQSYITSFLERDIPMLGFDIPPQQIRRFWMMLAHYHGQIFNASELGKSLGLSGHTVKRYLDILSGTFMIRILQPWFENIQKRQVKSPKIYFRDSGVLNALLGIADTTQLETYPRLGSFWEGFALEEIIRLLDAAEDECYFWSTQANAELDLLIIKNGKKIGFEFKYTDTPKITKSMHIALSDLNLDQIIVIYPGSSIFPLSDSITCVGFESILTDDFKKLIQNKLFTDIS